MPPHRPAVMCIGREYAGSLVLVLRLPPFSLLSPLTSHAGEGAEAFTDGRIKGEREKVSAEKRGTRAATAIHTCGEATMRTENAKKKQK